MKKSYLIAIVAIAAIAICLGVKADAAGPGCKGINKWQNRVENSESKRLRDWYVKGQCTIRSTDHGGPSDHCGSNNHMTVETDYGPTYHIWGLKLKNGYYCTTPRN
jgi:hypothetical protein